MESISADICYQLCAVVDGEHAVSLPSGWSRVWGHLPAADKKLLGNYAALYLKGTEVPPGSSEGTLVPSYIIAIQGTKDAKDILEDFNVGCQVPFAPIENALISAGSSDALADVLQLKDDSTGVSLKDTLLGLPENATLVVTGHSLGGNMASVLGPWVSANVPNFGSDQKPEFPPNLGVVTFAAPTAGNDVFAQFLNRQETYEAHFNLNDVVSNVWAQSGELCLAHVDKLFPAPGPSPAPPLVKTLLAAIQSRMARHNTSYVQTRGEFFTYPCATPPPNTGGAEKDWLWELNYQHNDAYNKMFLKPEREAQATTK